MNFIIGITVAVIFGLAILSMISMFLRRVRFREMGEMFRNYNQKSDVQIIINWIHAKHSGLRLMAVLEYLQKIEENALAAKVFLGLGFDAYPGRAIRILATKILRQERKPEALTLAERLREDCPNDDSVLEIYIDTLLVFERWSDAAALLSPRLQAGVEGTSFLRQHAQVLAGTGHLEEAIKRMEKIAEQDLRRYKNTIAPAEKRLLFDQSEISRALLEKLIGIHQGTLAEAEELALEPDPT